ncbi:hypothetical protein [Arenimonas daejeonensis]|uniref:hypothetical protein n=1 Tax=Arenimonas daejeonensis TaxID=370777 RepID=UPI0011BD61D5|nr:hypothetical protein [Arenimonas daejeonensis]
MQALTSFRHGIGRPLPMLSFALDYAFWGGNPLGYKISGLAVHLVNALLVFVLLQRILSLLPGAVVERDRIMAGLIAAAWATHPLQVSTVLYVVQRMETLSLLFVLLALLFYLAGRTRQAEGRRGWPLLAICPPLVALGLACKETAALFPVYALALELTILRFRAHAPGRLAHGESPLLRGSAWESSLLRRSCPGSSTNRFTQSEVIPRSNGY